MPSAPPEAAVERFKQDLLELTGALPKAGVGICVSGGADSLALLLLAKAALPNIEAATVDHGLRAESGSEAVYVAEICAQLGAEHTILTLSAQPRGNLSDWARTARYSVLERWADERELGLLLTAHHADDQLETMIMRLNRGSGVGGLAGIRPKNGRVVRPLLGWRKAELEALVRQCEVTPVNDPSNHNPRFDRARLRKTLSGVDWLDPLAASKSAAALADGDDALRWAAEALEGERVIQSGNEIRFDAAAIPRELLRRLVTACIERIAPGAQPRGQALDRAIATLQSGKTTTLAGVKATGGAMWRFSDAPPRKKSG
jgi:tRNA(Ile)-lysidine synthase